MRAAVASFVLSLAFCAPNARGEVISRDWVTPGDGLLTYDTVNQREWLDLSQTQLFQFEPVDTPFGEDEGRVLAVIEETQPGGRFEGFQVAGRDDLNALAESAGIDLSTRLLSVNGEAAGTLLSLLSPTDNPPFTQSVGFLNEAPGRSGRPWGRVTYNVGDTSGGAGVRFGDFFNSRYGVWLYRPVPEPSSILLAVFFAAAGFLVKRKCRRPT